MDFFPALEPVFGTGRVQTAEKNDHVSALGEHRNSSMYSNTNASID